MSQNLALEIAEQRVIPPRNKWKATVTVDYDVVTKTFKHHAFTQRWIGRLLLNREQRALLRLDGVPGVPHFLSRTGPYTLRISRISGIPLRECYAHGISESALENLIVLFNDIHNRGVGHGDAHHRNILIDGDRAGLIDFSTAYVTRDTRHPSRIFQWYLALDQRAMYKIEDCFFHLGSPPKMFLLYRLVKHRKPSTSPRGTDV